MIRMARYITLGCIYTPMHVASTLLLPRDSDGRGARLVFCASLPPGVVP
jgi:hypothetical protein